MESAAFRGTALIVARPFLRLAFILALPYIGMAALAGVGGRALFGR